MSLDPDKEPQAASIHAERIADWKGVAQANKAETIQRSLMGRLETKEKMEEARRGVRNSLKTSSSVDDSKTDEALSEFYGTWDDILEKEFDYSDMDTDDMEESIPNRPKGAEYFFDKDLEGFSDTIKELKENERFSAKLTELSEKYGISEREILMVGAKESSLMTNPAAKNMFQILAAPAKEAGIDLKKLNKSKNPVDQLNALEKYLDRWNYADYNGSVPLGLLIAAPSARDKDKDFVVYREGSKELEANPKWAGEDGNATVGSIIKFYRGEV
tara:strand:+ start:262 stop:1080 length:819 start_codon:yes stop_codon:yes gene_type:complete